jgi:hypothetical protein
MSSFWTSSHLSKCVGDSTVIANNFVEDHKNQGAQVMQHFGQLYQMKLRQQQHAPQVYDLDVRS